VLLTIPWFRPKAIHLFDLPAWDWLPPALEIHPFGMLVGMAVITGALVMDRRARTEGLHPRVVGEMLGYILISGFVFGHVLDAVLYHWDTVLRRPMFVLELWNGLSSFGGFVGAVIGGAFWARMRKLSFVVFADPIAYAFVFGWIFGRLGCFLAHDHPGRVSDFFLAVEDYHAGTSPYQARHDLGLYEAIWAVSASAIFFVLGRRQRVRGFYLALLPILYAPVRFALDFLRATDVPQADPRTLGLTPGQWGSLLLLAIGIALFFYVRRVPRAIVPADVRWQPKRAPKMELARAGEIEEAIAGGARVFRWAPGEKIAYAPAGFAVTDLREASLDEHAWYEIADAHARRPAPDMRVWLFRAAQMPEDEKTEARETNRLLGGLARAKIEAPSAPDVVVVVGEPQAHRTGRLIAGLLKIPVWIAEGSELPFAAVELEDGRVVGGMIGAPRHTPA
jgi:phosphatidylglycerol---prolipoprotein diacylglyceryl transferase